MGNAATTVLGRSAGRGFVTGAGLAATRQLLTDRESGVDSAARPSGTTPPPPAQSSLLVPVPPSCAGTLSHHGCPASQALAHSRRCPDRRAGDGGTPPVSPPGGSDDALSLTRWSQPSAQQIQQAAAKLEPASPDVENAAFDLARAGHQQAHQWEQEGRSPVLPDGSLDPQFVEEVVQQEPDAAAALIAGQTAANLPPDQRLSVGEAVALGVTTQRSIPGQQVRQGLARAVKATGQGGDLNSALQDELGAGTEAVFGGRAEQVEDMARQMQDAGLANDLGRQLVETVGENRGAESPAHRSAVPGRGGHGRLARMRQWDRATGDPETTDRIVGGLIGLGAFNDASVQEIPRPPTSPTEPRGPSTATYAVSHARSTGPSRTARP